MEKVVCPKCGSSNFKVLMEQVLRDVHNNTKVTRGFEYTDASIDEEKIIEAVCLNCGTGLVQKYVKPPISKREWEDFWEEYLSNYIIGFQHYVADVEEPENPEDWFLQGMARGMWTLYKLIESEMVARH